MAEPASERGESSFDDDADYRPSRPLALHTSFARALGQHALLFDARERILECSSTRFRPRSTDPSPERDQAASDPAGLSINSTRGVAVQAAITCTAWSARHLGDSGNVRGGHAGLRELRGEA